MDSSKELRESAELLQELLFRSAARYDSYMSVSEMRRALAQVGQNVDGSGEVLGARLEEAFSDDGSAYDSENAEVTDTDDELSFDSAEDDASDDESALSNSMEIVSNEVDGGGNALDA